MRSSRLSGARSGAAQTRTGEWPRSSAARSRAAAESTSRSTDAGRQRQAGADVARADRLDQLLLGDRVEGEHLEQAVAGVDRGEGRPEREPGRLDQPVQVGGHLGPQRQRLEDADQVADRHLLVEQRLQDALDLAGGEQRRRELLDDDRVGALEVVEQGPDVLAAEQPAGVLADDLAEVRDQDRGAVDDGGAVELGLLAQLGRHPLGGQAEDRLAGVLAGQRGQVVADGQDVPGGQARPRPPRRH